MPRKLAVLFDGTWNTTKDRTNVLRLSELIASSGTDGAEQLPPFYDKGVGTHAFDRLTGGVFGYGLSENIRDGYCWLAEHFRPGDELFLFGFSRDSYQWHDTELSKIVDYAYHALAVDEHRKDFAPAVWTLRKPENIDVEQRWFIGAHSNVGGGYRNDPLPKLALAWLQQKARAAGLGFKADVVVNDQDALAKINDSYSEFMSGLYKLFKGDKRYYRVFGRGVNETVDDSVWKRWDTEPGYRPPTLLGMAARRG